MSSRAGHGEWFKALADSDLERAPYLVALALARHADWNTGTVRIGTERMAAYARLKVSATRAALQSLEAAGVVRFVKRGGGGPLCVHVIALDIDGAKRRKRADNPPTNGGLIDGEPANERRVQEENPPNGALNPPTNGGLWGGNPPLDSTIHLKDTPLGSPHTKRGPSAEVPPVELIFPPELDTPAFRQAWSDYEAHRREKRAPKLTPRSTAAKLADLGRFGELVATAAIRTTIGNGWTGIFPERETANGTNTSQRRGSGYGRFVEDQQDRGRTLYPAQDRPLPT